MSASTALLLSVHSHATHLYFDTSTSTCVPLLLQLVFHTASSTFLVLHFSVSAGYLYTSTSACVFLHSYTSTSTFVLLHLCFYLSSSTRRLQYFHTSAFIHVHLRMYMSNFILLHFCVNMSTSTFPSLLQHFYFPPQKIKSCTSHQLEKRF